MNSKLKKSIILKPWTFRQTSKQFIVLKPKTNLNSNDFLAKLVKVLKYLLIIILGIGFVVVTKFGAIILVIVLSKALNKKNK